MPKPNLLVCRLIKTQKRLTFDIVSQCESVTFDGPDDGDYLYFRASNGYEVISRSRMDLDTERLWLRGGTNDEIAKRSGTKPFPSDEARDKAYDNFVKALQEWAEYNGGEVTILPY